VSKMMIAYLESFLGVSPFQQTQDPRDDTSIDILYLSAHPLRAPPDTPPPTRPARNVAWPSSMMSALRKAYFPINITCRLAIPDQGRSRRERGSWWSRRYKTCYITRIRSVLYHIFLLYDTVHAIPCYMACCVSDITSYITWQIKHAIYPFCRVFVTCYMTYYVLYNTLRT
jgi:hypothetical protein